MHSQQKNHDFLMVLSFLQRPLVIFSKGRFFMYLFLHEKGGAL